MRLDFEVTYKASEHDRSVLKLSSLVNKRGLRIDEGTTNWLLPCLATIEINSSDSNLMDEFCFGDVVSLDLKVTRSPKNQNKGTDKNGT